MHIKVNMDRQMRLNTESIKLRRIEESDTIERPSEIMILISMEILGGVFSLVEGLLNITTFGSMTPTNGGSSTLIII